MTEPKPDKADPAVKPQVIDLEAEDVTEAEQKEMAAENVPAADDEISAGSGGTRRENTDAAAPPPPPGNFPLRRSRPVWLLFAVAAVATAGGGFAYRNLLSSYFPTAETTLLKDRVDALEAGARTAETQREALSSGIGAVDTRLTDLQAVLAATQNSGKAAQESAGELSARLDAFETELRAVRSDLDGLRSSLSSGAGAAGGTVSDAAVAAFSQRIEAIEKDVAALKSHGMSGGGEAAAALTQSLADLRARIAEGQPFAAEHVRLQSLVPAASGLDTLAAFAADGLPNAQGLAAELRAVIPNLPPPDAGSETDDGALGGFWDMLKTVITIRRIGERDWPALAGRAAAAAAGGNLGEAVNIVSAAQGTLPPDLARWRDRAEARLKLEAAVDEVAQAVLRQIAAMGPSP